MGLKRGAESLGLAYGLHKTTLESSASTIIPAGGQYYYFLHRTGLMRHRHLPLPKSHIRWYNRRSRALNYFEKGKSLLQLARPYWEAL